MVIVQRIQILIVMVIVFLNYIELNVSINMKPLRIDLGFNNHFNHSMNAIVNIVKVYIWIYSVQIILSIYNQERQLKRV